MFYDDVFQEITEKSAFSEEVVITVSSEEYKVRGMYCSGSYGQKDYDKGYSVGKTVNAQSFKISLQSLPAGVAPKDLMRQTLTLRGKSFTIRDVTGNNSGILSLDLVPGASDA